MRLHGFWKENPQFSWLLENSPCNDEPKEEKQQLTCENGATPFIPMSPGMHHGNQGF